MVSPICFLSCRSKGPCQVNLSLPHAVNMPQEDCSSRLAILSTATAKIDADPNSPFFSPSERVLAPLDGIQIEYEKDRVKFLTDLRYPSLFAVAVRDGPGSIPLPLRCCLYVLYPELEQSNPMVAGFDIETYVGMKLQTVATVCAIIQVHVHVIIESVDCICRDGTNTPLTNEMAQISRTGRL